MAGIQKQSSAGRSKSAEGNYGQNEGCDSKYACVDIPSNKLNFLFQLRRRAIRNTAILRSQHLHLTIEALLALYATIYFGAKAGTLSKIGKFLTSFWSCFIVVASLPHIPQGEEPHSCTLCAPLKMQKNTTGEWFPQLLRLGIVLQSTEQLQFSAEINIKCQINSVFI